jgi:polysaccharide pyruvyl transferase WcaK-like protein
MRITFWGNFGTGNLGNECTLQALIHNVRRLLPESELACVCRGPDDTSTRHGVRSIPMTSRRGTGQPLGGPLRKWYRSMAHLVSEARDLLRALGVLRGVDLLVMSGTGMLSDSGEGPFGLTFEMAKWATAARIRGCRTAFVSVGAEALDSALARRFTRLALRLADFRSYRDALSKERLRKIGFDSGPDAVYPDLAFSLPEALWCERTPPTGRQSVVAVGIYDYMGGRHAQRVEYRAYVAKLCSFIGWLHGQGHTVRLVIGDFQYDEAVRQDVLASLEAGGLTAASVQHDVARSVAELVAQLNEADYVVATRFHSVVLSLMLGKPVVSLSYDDKNDVLMAEMGLAAYCQRLAELDVDRLIVQFLDLRSRADSLRPRIRETVERNRAALDQQYQRLFGVSAAGDRELSPPRS